MVQDNYLLEIRGDVREGLAPSTEDESMQSAEAGDKLFYVVREYFFTCGGEPQADEQTPKWTFPICQVPYLLEMYTQPGSAFSLDIIVSCIVQPTSLESDNHAASLCVHAKTALSLPSISGFISFSPAASMMRLTTLPSWS